MSQLFLIKELIIQVKYIIIYKVFDNINIKNSQVIRKLCMIGYIFKYYFNYFIERQFYYKNFKN